MEYVIAASVVVILVLLYFIMKQNFTVYTSGASQRYAAEFTSTNQEHFGDYMEPHRQTAASIMKYVQGAWSKDNFTSENRFANDKHKIAHNSPKSEKMERELFEQTHPLNL